MERQSRDRTLMEVAQVIAKRGTCSRLQVGAVLSRDGRIISTGYNGTPASMPHCIHEEFKYPSSYHDAPKVVPEWLTEYLNRGDVTFETPPWNYRFYYDGESITTLTGTNGDAPGCRIAEHAEQNAIVYAARHGMALEGSELYVTNMPCINCARALVGAGISRVLYLNPYRLLAGVEYLQAAGINVSRIPDMV